MPNTACKYPSNTTTQIPAPTLTPANTRQRVPLPRDHACDRARTASAAEAGSAGYSVTVAHPATSPTANPQRKCRRAASLSRTFKAAANAKMKHAPTSACAQNKLAYAHSGVPTHITSVANAEPPASPPSRKPRKNKQTPASAVGKATVYALTTYDKIHSPRGDSGSTPAILIAGRAANANGTARKTSPGALSE